MLEKDQHFNRDMGYVDRVSERSAVFSTKDPHQLPGVRNDATSMSAPSRVALQGVRAVPTVGHSHLGNQFSISSRT